LTDKQNSQTDTIENIITLAARMAISQKHLLENSHRLCYARRQRWIRRGNAALSDVMFGVPHRRTAARRSRDVACYIVPPDTRGRAGGGGGGGGKPGEGRGGSELRFPHGACLCDTKIDNEFARKSYTHMHACVGVAQAVSFTRFYLFIFWTRKRAPKRYQRSSS